MSSNTLYWLAANRLPGIGPVTIRQCLAHVKTMQALFAATPNDLRAMGLTLKQQQALLAPPLDAAEGDLVWCQKHNCHLLTLESSNYPSLLQQIADPPLVLFVKGEVSLLSKPQLAMVGTRHPSITGQELAFELARQLVMQGLVITSGLALGIDTASHQGAVEAKGKTIAVFGNGLASVYPSSNRRLAQLVEGAGAIVSEFPPFEQPKARNFPRRNRVISGLSLGVLVVEAAIRSGSLVTARFALEQGREVFAIPGSVKNPKSQGCHALIRQGATLVEKPEDILEQLGSLYSYVTMRAQTKVAQQKVSCEKLDVKSIRLLEQIAYEVTPMDVIILRSGLTASQVSSILLTLEMLGCIKNVQGGYVRVR